MGVTGREKPGAIRKKRPGSAVAVNRFARERLERESLKRVIDGRRLGTSNSPADEGQIRIGESAGINDVSS